MEPKHSVIKGTALYWYFASWFIKTTYQHDVSTEIPPDGLPKQYTSMM